MLLSKRKTTNKNLFLTRGNGMIKHDSKKMRKAEKVSKIETKFSYDLERMKKMVDSKTIKKPEGLKGSALTDWLMSH